MSSSPSPTSWPTSSMWIGDSGPSSSWPPGSLVERRLWRRRLELARSSEWRTWFIFLSVSRVSKTTIVIMPMLTMRSETLMKTAPIPEVISASSSSVKRMTRMTCQCSMPPNLQHPPSEHRDRGLGPHGPWRRWLPHVTALRCADAHSGADFGRDDGARTDRGAGCPGGGPALFRRQGFGQVAREVGGLPQVAPPLWYMTRRTRRRAARGGSLSPSSCVYI
mmetsp:Transcript_104878/g.302629  ORF Transcript_104878/g.302629 Transcript_104878/m.302629 type:complete len:221 (-) Transcript_104878:36-698(-)